MKIVLLVCLPMLTLCSASSQKKQQKFHSELNDAIRDLTRVADWGNKEAILNRINMALSGGAELRCTEYKIDHILNEVPRVPLERKARENQWHGILKLLGVWAVSIKKDEQ